MINNRNLIIKLKGELDHHIAQDLREEIDSLLDKNPIKSIIFDFSNINFMDSSGIGVIIGRYRKISKFGGVVSVVNLNKQVRKIFELSGIDKIIKAYDTYEEAVSSL